MSYQVLTIPVTLFSQNCRVLLDASSSSAIVVDPGGEGNRILEAIDSHRATVTEIWLTHSHLDHCGGVWYIKEKTGAKLLGTDHPIERAFRERVEDQCRNYGVTALDMKKCPEPDRFISEKDELAFAGHTFQVLFTPGHSPGHLCYYDSSSQLLLAGDTLFEGSIGRTDLPGGDYETLIKSITDKIFSLPEETKVLPGHGPDTSVGEEKRTNPFFTFK